MLPGTDIAGALIALECFDEIDVIGMNCGVGPDLMLDQPSSILSRHSPETDQRASECRTAGDSRRRDVFSAATGRPGRLARALRHRVRRQHRRRLLRHDQRSPESRRGPAPRQEAGTALADIRPGRFQPARLRGTATRNPGRCSSASGPTRTDLGNSSNCSKKKTGTASSKWPRSRNAKAFTCSTSAWTTSAATASAT